MDSTSTLERRLQRGRGTSLCLDGYEDDEAAHPGSGVEGRRRRPRPLHLAKDKVAGGAGERGPFEEHGSTGSGGSPIPRSRLPECRAALAVEFHPTEQQTVGVVGAGQDGTSPPEGRARREREETEEGDVPRPARILPPVRGNLRPVGGGLPRREVAEGRSVGRYEAESLRRGLEGLPPAPAVLVGEERRPLDAGGGPKIEVDEDGPAGPGVDLSREDPGLGGAKSLSQ